MLEWNTLLLDCSSQRGEHLCNWHIWSISNGSQNNSSTRSLRVSNPRHPFVISATITRDPSMLRVKHSINKLFLSQGEHFRNWHIWSISDGSQNNSSTRSQRVSILRHLFVLSATISRDPWMPEWNTLLIDCSSNEANIFEIDILDLSLMVLEIIQVQGPSGVQFLDIFFCISNNNSRSRNDRVKHSINRLFLSTRRTFLKLTYLIFL